MQQSVPINLHNVHLLGRKEVGDLQCDQHRRDKDDEAGRAQRKAHKRLVKKLSPFVWLDDQSLDVATFAETVAKRLMEWATQERERRIAVCPEGFEHLLK